MYGSITLHIDNVSHFVRLQVGREMLDTCFPELLENRYLVPLRLPCGFVIVDVYLNISDYM